jgi:DNA-3-methyladenine glycosylase
MLNIVTGKKDYPAAVLIRGVEGLHGPGKLTKKLKITGDLNGKILSKKTDLWIERGEKIPKNKIEKSARVGVDYAGPIWAKKEWRFILKK